MELGTLPYAESTSVPVRQSRTEIETLLERHGCDAIATMQDAADRTLAIQFRLQGRILRFNRQLPDPESDAVRLTPTGIERSPSARAARFQQLERTTWRGLLLCIRAKLEAIESGIETLDEAFMAAVVMPDGSTLGDRVIPAIADTYETGRMPAFGFLQPPQD